MKLKTHKMTAKKVRLTKKKKLITKKCGQDHFNARETGKVSRNKRSDTLVKKTEVRNIRRQIPYA